jgi:hypothetical protein
MIAPLAYLHAASKLFLSFIPKPTKTGFFNSILRRRCKYFSTRLKSFSFPVVDEDETAYKIPFGNLFRYISCPNHFGEIIEWAGYALLCWNLPASAFFIWTSANLIPRAIAHHHWYREHFSDYPMNRKAVIPFIL